MSTRCTISIALPDGKIKSIYCHHDGYLSGVGKTLFEEYDTEEKIHELLAHGDLSSLSGYLSSYKERGETGTDAQIYPSMDYVENQQFNYLFKDGKWFYSFWVPGGKYTEFVELIEKLVS